MPYAVEFMPPVADYLVAIPGFSVAAVGELVRDAENELGADADRLHLRNQKPPGAQTFEYEVPIGDSGTQYLFRFIVTMEFAAQGVVRVVFVDHDVLGTTIPSA